MIKPDNPQVAAAFMALDADTREMAFLLRGLILNVAAQTPAVGPLTETLKWGQPAYLTAQTKSGTTLRIGQPKTGGCAIYAHCATTVISRYAAMFSDLDQIEGNRAVHFKTLADIVPDRLPLLIRHALSYRR